MTRCWPTFGEVSRRMFRIELLLAEQGSAVTRTDDFSGETPTMVFLASGGTRANLAAIGAEQMR
jgi:hypothetical protein